MPVTTLLWLSLKVFQFYQQILHEHLLIISEWCLRRKRMNEWPDYVESCITTPVPFSDIQTNKTHQTPKQTNNPWSNISLLCSRTLVCWHTPATSNKFFKQMRPSFYFFHQNMWPFSLLSSIVWYYTWLRPFSKSQTGISVWTNLSLSLKFINFKASRSNDLSRPVHVEDYTSVYASVVYNSGTSSNIYSSNEELALFTEIILFIHRMIAKSSSC